MRADTPKRIRAADARNNFADILARAHFAGETFLIEKQGKPYAVIIGIDEYRRLLDSLGLDFQSALARAAGRGDTETADG